MNFVHKTVSRLDQGHSELHRGILRLLFALTLLLAATQTARAQFGGNPNDRPAFSPYLNLLRGSQNNAVLNYHGLVRPQNEFFQRSGQLNQGLYSLQQQAQQPGGLRSRQGSGLYSRMGVTGHPTAFMTLQSAGGSVGYTVNDETGKVSVHTSGGQMHDERGNCAVTNK